jgi:serine/threonine-protein kinase
MAVSLREVLCFGRYEPLFRIAAGGMAEVYAARIQGEAGFQKLLAVKRMLPHLARDPGFVDMFLNEAKLAAHVASPHVVQTLDLGRGTDGSLYIVMELVVGLSLARLIELRPGPLPPAIALELLAQAAQGLDDAHEARTPAGDPLGLVHRDVSPHNILLGLDGRVRVTDFGIARAVHRPRAETNVRELKGKFAYMSPEQTRLEPLDRRTDVFSLGIVLWEALTGERLFAERDALEAVRLVQRKPIADPRERRPELSAGVAEVVLRALERDRGRRFQTSGELAVALRRAAREAFGEPPERKALAAFVEAAGGEELGRLQRLIRLGTEGAALDTIEAVQPGVTRVLPEDASGVAVLGTGARRTAQVEEGPPTLTLPLEDLEELDDEASSQPSHHPNEGPTAIFASPRAPTSTGEVTRLAKPVGKSAPAPGAPLASPEPPPRAGVRWTLLALVLGGGAAVAIGVAIAVALVAPPPAPREAAILPLDEPAPPLAAPVAAPPPVVEAPAVVPPPSNAVAAPPTDPAPAPAPLVDRRRRPSPRPTRTTSAPREQPRTPLLDVSEFDRRTR